MALRVWLPLNGNLENQGLSTLVPTGTPTFLDNGKIGKCISLTPRISFAGMPRMDNFTILFWLKVDSCASDWADSLCFWSFNTEDEKGSDLRFEATKTSRACSFHNNATYTITQASRILVTEAQKGEWHHCGFSYDGEHCYTYIDGVLTYTDTGLGGYIYNYFHIGETNNMVGGMNDLRIYDECLSLKQIKEISKGLVAHYKLEGIGANPNLALNTLTTSPSSFYDYTGKASASRITDDDVFTSVYKIDFPEDTATYSNYNLYTVIPRDSSAVIQDGKTYTLSFKIKASKPLSNYKLYYEYNNKVVETDIDTNWKKITLTGIANSQYSALYLCHTQANRLKINGGSLYIAEIKLELGEVATNWVPHIADSIYTSLGYNNIITRDVSGNNYNLTMTGNLTYNEDSPRYEGSTTFDGNSYLQTKTGSMVWFPFDKCTLSCWLNPTTAPANWAGSVGVQHNGGAGSKMFSISNYAGKFSVQLDSGTAYVTVQSETLPLNTWTYCAATIDGTTLKMYMNGELVKTYTLDWGEATVRSETNFCIGVDIPGGDETFVGSISDVRLYTTVLSADDILTMYKTSGIIDNKGNVYVYEFKEE